MRPSIRFSITSGIAGAVAVLLLCSGGAAWAGNGGSDLASEQIVVNALCVKFGMTSCPQLPTLTQAILEAAALGNNLPEMLRTVDNDPPGSAVTAGNPAAPPAAIPFIINSNGTHTAILPTATTTPSTSTVLSGLTPLASVSQSAASGTGLVTQLSDPNADTFVYAVGVSSTQSVMGGLTDPDRVYFFFEDLNRTNQNGTISARFLLPSTVLDSNGEHAAPTTLAFTGTNGGDCSMSTVSGSFSNTPIAASAIGIDCTVVFSASPTSIQSHAIFEVSVPTLATPSTDPADYLSSNPINTGVLTAFRATHANMLLPNGVSIGLSPTAEPLCSDLYNGMFGSKTVCPKPPVPGFNFPPYPFALCASLPVNTNGAGSQLRPAVGVYYAIATSGEMWLSAALPSVSVSFCPAF
jgi:hypothetical protein